MTLEQLDLTVTIAALVVGVLCFGAGGAIASLASALARDADRAASRPAVWLGAIALVVVVIGVGVLASVMR